MIVMYVVSFIALVSKTQFLDINILLSFQNHCSQCSLTLNGTALKWAILKSVSCMSFLAQSIIKSIYMKITQNIYIYFYKFIYFILFLFLVVLGLRCCTRAFSSCGERGLLFVAVRGLLIAVASLVAEHRLQVYELQQLRHTGSVVVAHRLQSTGSVVVAHGLSCSAACGIFLDQGSNPCPLHWQVDS